MKLAMTQVNSIRSYFFDKGYSIAEIQRKTGNDRKTIKKYIEMQDFNESEPKLKTKRPSKIDPFKAEIDSWLTEDKLRKKKQRHTAKRVFDRLKENHGEEFQCSYRLVATYVSSRKKEIYGGDNNFYLPLKHIPGEAQVDFGEAEFYEKNVLFTGHFLNLSFPSSNAGFTQVFKGENKQCLMEGLKNIFDYLGGVPHKIWFDNASSMVNRILSGNKRKLNNMFMNFINHYGFTATYCNPSMAQEKGNVENKVGYHRRNLFVPIPRIDDLKKFNRDLLKRCEEDMNRLHYVEKKQTITELFAEDKKQLLPLPAVEFDESELISVTTDCHGKFKLNKGKHTYSTAPRFASSGVYARLTAHEVIVLDENYREAIRHQRLYGKEYQESFDWLPYLTQLARRPRALKYTGIYDLFSPSIKDYLERCDHSTQKDILKVLAKISDKTSFEKAVNALQTAINYGVDDTESVLAIFNRQNSEALNLAPLVLAQDVPELPPFSSRLSSYDLMLERGCKN